MPAGLTLPQGRMLQEICHCTHRTFDLAHRRNVRRQGRSLNRL
jgi:hypothetical protein